MERPAVHLGINLPAQHTTWAALREAVLAADAARLDSVWTWDHFRPLTGRPDGPFFEAWQLLAAWGASTKHVRVGTLVTGVTHRHPALLAKMVATLDHITDGRAILGLGGAWYEEEHAMYGLRFPPVPERLDLLEETCAAFRLLESQARTTFAGERLQLDEALFEPKPVQARLPILIGGDGERRTLRTAARHADFWHGEGDLDYVRRKVAVLEGHCADIGRHPREIAPLLTLPRRIVLRASLVEARGQLRQEALASGETPRAVGPDEVIHEVDAVVAAFASYWNAGARGFIVDVNAPFDLETITRLGTEVRPRLEAAIDAA